MPTPKSESWKTNLSRSRKKKQNKNIRGKKRKAVRQPSDAVVVVVAFAVVVALRNVSWAMDREGLKQMKMKMKMKGSTKDRTGGKGSRVGAIVSQQDEMMIIPL